MKPGTETNYYYLLSEDSVDQVIHDRLIAKETRLREIIESRVTNPYAVFIFAARINKRLLTPAGGENKGGTIMPQARERTDLYAEKVGYSVLRYLFACVSSGNPVILQGELNAEVFRSGMLALFREDLEDARISLTFVSAQAWYVAVQAGLPEKKADRLLDVYFRSIRTAGAVVGVWDAYTEFLVALAREVSLLRQPRVADSRIQQVIRYICAHICEPIPVSQVAAAINVTPSYLSREFKAATGKTVIAYIQEEKVRNAKALLQNQTLSVTDVMERLGYVSQSHFTKVFREQTGLTPARYQAAVRTKDSLPEPGSDSPWDSRLKIYRELMEFRQRKGEELEQYLLGCVRRGNLRALEEEFQKPDCFAPLYSLFRDKVDVAMEAFLSAWPQVMYAAKESGVPVDVTVSIFGSFVSELYGCVSIHQALDLNCKYHLRMAAAVRELGNA